jgi:hypothetical protein
MPKIVEFVVIFDDGVRKRHRHETIDGKVVRFVVQLEIRVSQEWKVAVRYERALNFYLFCHPGESRSPEGIEKTRPF